MLTQEKGEGGKKTSGENLKEKCHAEFTKGEQARNRQLSPAGDGRHGAGQYHAVRRRPDLVQRREWKSGSSSAPAGTCRASDIQETEFLARGVDALAHQGTMTLGGWAIGAIGTGMDGCDRKENKKLQEKMLERGAILSELPAGVHPAAGEFSGAQPDHRGDAVGGCNSWRGSSTAVR